MKKQSKEKIFEMTPEEKMKLKESFEGKTPKEVMEAIDEKFESLKGKVNRIDLKWGIWSRIMNLYINSKRKVLKPGDESTRWMFVAIYWTIRSRMLDLHMKHKITRAGRMRKETRDLKIVKSSILSPKPLNPISEKDLIKAVLRK